MAGQDDNRAKDADLDPIERAMRRRAEAEAAAKRPAAPVAPIVGSAMDTRASAPRSTPEPSAARPRVSPPELRAPAVEPAPYEPPRYEPGEGSFFSSSAEERAEQARRAAQRVRRRARGEDMDAPFELDEELVEDTPPARPEAPPQRAEPPQKPAPQAFEFRATEPPISTPEPVPSAVAEPSVAPPPRPAEPKPSPPKRESLDLFSRMADARKSKAKPAEPPAPSAAAPAPAARPVVSPQASKPAGAATVKAAAAIPLIERAGRPAPAKAKPTTTARAAATPTVTPTSRAPRPNDITSRASEPKQRTPSPVAPRTDAKSVQTEQPFESLYAERDDVVAPDQVDLTVTRRAPASPMRIAKTKPFSPFEWMVASRYLRARKKEGFVSVIAGFSLLGIALGVATLIVVMAVLTGFRETFITQILGSNAHISVTSQTERFEDFDSLAMRIKGVDGIVRVSPQVEGQVLATGARNHTGVLIKGVRAEDLNDRALVTNPEERVGSLATFKGDEGVAIGQGLAHRLGLRVGDYITLISPDGDITPFSATPMPRKKDYPVAYIYRVGFSEVDNFHLYMPLSEAQIYLNKGKSVDQLEVFVDNPDLIEQYEDPIRRAARSSIGLFNWKIQNGQFIAALDIERKVMFVVLTMIILVAALNIISGLVMLVKDKARGVAIMRTMGMARGSVLRIFFICGSSIGVIGSIAGVILGVLFALNINTIERGLSVLTGNRLWDPNTRMGIAEVPSSLQTSDVLFTLGIALGLSFLATLFPAWKAAKTDPVEALRYE